MKTVLLYVKITTVTIILMILLSAGCDGDKANVGYYYIDIPGYEVADYEQMLNSNNPEEQYNALAYLSFNFEDTKVLKYDSMKGTGRYDTALRIYNKAVSLTLSSNSWVSSAAFHLLDQYEYNQGQKDYRKKLLANRNPSTNVQMEIFVQIRKDSITDYASLKEKIRFLKEKPSWLLKKSAYVLMKQGDSLMMNDVMNEYSTNTNPVDKLLLLDALTTNINEAVFNFLTHVWDTTKDERVKNIITHYFPYAHSSQQVLDWYGKHVEVLKKQMNYFIVNDFAKATASPILSQLIVLGIEKGWAPKDLLTSSEEEENNNTPKLYFYLLYNKYEPSLHPDSIRLKQSANSKRVEEALLNHPVWNKEWLAYELKYKPRPIPSELIAAHKKVTETYIKETLLLMEKYGIDSINYIELIKTINNNASSFYKERLKP